ncbi:MAG: tetratricopeptide repeat protein [Bdellovibrionota bacterium]
MDRRSFAVGLLSLSILFSCVKPSPKSIPITPQQQQDALLLYKAGVQKLQTKQFNPALEDFIRVVSQYPSSSSADNAYLRIGQIYALQNRKRSAAESYQKLIRDYPDSDVYDPALRDLGHLYFEAHRLDDGLRYYSQIQLDKLRMEDQRKIVERSTQALQQTKDDSLAIKWLIALDQSRYPSKPS